MSTLMVSSLRSLCLTSVCFDLGALSQHFFPTIYLVGVAISLSGQRVFNIYGTASFVSNEVESNLEEPITFLYITRVFSIHHVRIC